MTRDIGHLSSLSLIAWTAGCLVLGVLLYSKFTFEQQRPDDANAAELKRLGAEVQQLRGDVANLALGTSGLEAKIDALVKAKTEPPPKADTR